MVSDNGAIFAQALSRIDLCQRKSGQITLVGLGALNGVETAAVNVLDEGPFKELLIGDLANKRGNGVKGGLAGGSIAPLPCYQLVAALKRSVE